MRLVVIAALSLCSNLAWAAPAPTAADADAAARRAAPAGAKISAEYDFENDYLEGEVLSPDHEGVRTKLTGTHESMLKLRAHFIPQMLQMANDV